MEQVDVSDELIDEGVRGIIVDPGLGCPHLLNQTANDGDAVGNLQRFLLIMGHEHAGDMQLIMQAPQPAPQFLADLGVKRAKGFVQKQHASPTASARANATR